MLLGSRVNKLLITYILIHRHRVALPVEIGASSYCLNVKKDILQTSVIFFLISYYLCEWWKHLQPIRNIYSCLFILTWLTILSSLCLCFSYVSLFWSISHSQLHSHSSFFTTLPIFPNLLVPTVLSTIAVAISPDGETVATSHGDHTIKIFKFYTGSYCLIFL